VKDFHWWDSIYTKAAQSVKIGENESSVEIVVEKQAEKGKAVYSGMFVTGGTIEDERKETSRKSSVKSEVDLFKVCGSRELRKFTQDGKKARCVPCTLQCLFIPFAGTHSVVYLSIDHLSSVCRLEEHDSAMQSVIDEHNRKRIDSIYKEITDAERKMLDKSERKKSKKEKEKKREANKKSAERKKKRKREETAPASLESSTDETLSELPAKKKRKQTHQSDVGEE